MDTDTTGLGSNAGRDVQGLNNPADTSSTTSRPATGTQGPRTAEQIAEMEKVLLDTETSIKDSIKALREGVNALLDTPADRPQLPNARNPNPSDATSQEAFTALGAALIAKAAVKKLQQAVDDYVAPDSGGTAPPETLLGHSKSKAAGRSGHHQHPPGASAQAPSDPAQPPAHVPTAAEIAAAAAAAAAARQAAIDKAEKDLIALIQKELAAHRPPGGGGSGGPPKPAKQWFAEANLGSELNIELQGLTRAMSLMAAEDVAASLKLREARQEGVQAMMTAELKEGDLKRDQFNELAEMGIIKAATPLAGGLASGAYGLRGVGNNPMDIERAKVRTSQMQTTLQQAGQFGAAVSEIVSNMVQAKYAPLLAQQEALKMLYRDRNDTIAKGENSAQKYSDDYHQNIDATLNKLTQSIDAKTRITLSRNS